MYKAEKLNNQKLRFYARTTDIKHGEIYEISYEIYVRI